MTTIICSTCGTVLNSEYKFCVSCGTDPRGVKETITESIPRKPETFFCPKCKHENPVDEIICVNCREDFGKYDIRKSFADTSKSRLNVLADVTQGYTHPSKISNLRIVLSIIASFVVIGAGVFIWWIIRYIKRVA